jgi:glutamine synthetase
MELMKKVALRHNLVCLLHEKPFAGVNGSGKHVNWALADNKGNNLLNPGETPEDNLQFLAVLAAVLRAVYLHSYLLVPAWLWLVTSIVWALTSAPPAIISVFLHGQQLDELLNMHEKGVKGNVTKQTLIDLGVTLPSEVQQGYDRQEIRTSPYRFYRRKVRIYPGGRIVPEYFHRHYRDNYDHRRFARSCGRAYTG